MSWEHRGAPNRYEPDPGYLVRLIDNMRYHSTLLVLEFQVTKHSIRKEGPQRWVSRCGLCGALSRAAQQAYAGQMLAHHLQSAHNL